MELEAVKSFLTSFTTVKTELTQQFTSTLSLKHEFLLFKLSKLPPFSLENRTTGHGSDQSETHLEAMF